MLEAVIAELGGQRALAQALGVTLQTVNQWVHKKRPIPPKRALAMQKLTGDRVSAASLRPDLADIFAVDGTAEERKPKDLKQAT